ncbi:hypothetical protein EON78_00120 [bacterium]|nr:MAG: hypothetical protein EON78_00120 [bacterium]
MKEGLSNRRKTVSKVSERWNAGTLLSLLKNTTLYGERRYTIGQDVDGENIYATVPCPPIISKDRWEKIQERRKKNAISGKKEVKYFTLLKGLITCEHCGNNMHSVIKLKKKQITYKCITKRVADSPCTESRAISIPKLDSLVWQVYLNSFYYNDEIFRTMSAQSNDTQTLQDEIDVREQELRSLNDDIVNINQKKVNLIDKIIDPRYSSNQKQLDNVLESLNKDSEILNSRIDKLVNSIKSLKKQLHDSNAYIDMYEEGLKQWNKIIEDFSHIQPPFTTKYEQVKAKVVIKRAVKKVSVEFLKDSNEHKIKIEFNSVDVKHQVPVEYDSRKGKYLEPIDGEDDFGGYRIIPDTWDFEDVVELIPVASKNPVGISMIMPILIVHNQRVNNIPPLGIEQQMWLYGKGW